MPTIQSLIDVIESLSGHALNKDEGVHFGEANRDINHLLVCWMPTVDALQQAGNLRADIVLCHESLFYPYAAEVRANMPPDWRDWPTNKKRIEWMERHGLTVMRVHGSLDQICIYDTFAELLDLGEPVQTVNRTCKIYEVTPQPLRDLVDRVKAAVGLDTIRVSAPGGLDQEVHRVGLPWGGLGLFMNVAYQQNCVAADCDVLIAGESDNYGGRFGRDLGIPLIETDHEVSENPGLRRFCDIVREHLPELDVSFHECRRPWLFL